MNNYLDAAWVIVTGVYMMVVCIGAWRSIRFWDKEEEKNGSRCRVSAECSGYRADAHTCNHEEEAAEYCGKRKN